MKIDNRFAVIMTLAIAGSLASTMSTVKAQSIPASTQVNKAVAQPNVNNTIKSNIVQPVQVYKVDSIVRTPNNVVPADKLKNVASTVMCPW